MKNFLLYLLCSALFCFAQTDSSLALSVLNSDTSSDTSQSIFASDSILFYPKNFPFEEPELPKIENKRLPFFIPLLEVIGQNILVWGWDRFVLRKNYAKITPAIWKRNLTEAWEWDDNHWGINFFGHPYQGSFYYIAGRASGYSFYESFLFSAFGSAMWEYFGEREYPAPNDFISTSVAGGLYGEILFRLSQRLLDKPDPTWIDYGGSFVLHPLSFLHWKAAGRRPNHPANFPIDFSLEFGTGKRFGNDYRFDKLSADRLTQEWQEHFASVGLELVYGNPNRKLKKPAEYFTVFAHYEQGPKQRLLDMMTSAKLHNYHLANGEHFFDLGLYLDSDCFYGDLVELASLSLGLGLDLSVPLFKKLTFRYQSRPGFMFLGTADFQYDDLLKEIDPDFVVNRTYQYNYGLAFKTGLELIFLERFRAMNRTSFYFMKTMPSTEPHYGARGYDIVGWNETFVEGKLTKRFSIGLRWDFYFKIAAYTGDYFEPMARQNHSFGAYTRIAIF